MFSSSTRRATPLRGPFREPPSNTKITILCLRLQSRCGITVLTWRSFPLVLIIHGLSSLHCFQASRTPFLSGCFLVRQFRKCLQFDNTSSRILSSDHLQFSIISVPPRAFVLILLHVFKSQRKDHRFLARRTSPPRERIL